MPSGGGGGGTKTKLPGYLTDYSTDILQHQADEYGKPYEAYTGDLVAGTTPDRLQAWEGVRQMQGGAEQDMLAGANRMTGLLDQYGQPISVDQLSAGQVGDVTGQFMNPYTQQVIDQTMDDYNRQIQTQLGQVGAQAANVGAFGGDRQALIEGRTRVEGAREGARIGADLRRQGYSQAMQNAMAMLQGNQQMQYNVGTFNAQQYQQDLQRQMQAAGMLPQMAAQRQAQRLQDVQALAASGQAQQDQRQRELDVQYQQFLEKRGWNQQQIDNFARTLASMPGGAGTVISGGGGGGLMGGLKGAAGGAATGATIGAAFGGFGAPIGAAAGGIAGGLMGGL